MRKVALKMNVSLDGFVGTSSGEVDWIFRSFDAELTTWIVDGLWQAGTHIMGRATYHEMADYWPESTEPFAPPMNEIPKVVFSKTLKDADWNGTRVAGGDLAEEIALLRKQPGKEILAHGGAGFAQSLSRLGLIDEYRLIVHPVVLGSGVSLFADPVDLKLLSSRRFNSGAVALTYERA
ncbi:dihydrofolate reductase family protein [Streptosporangium carneum]|uniref:Dihydrofolate reductase n=1 Tax=Streptosporangium carneum TaxID=47481 RepID=A0A9W6MFW2_9ACTN|nr:dihydrofolate reductase family protein [Streptosporangium carneum]GLK12686.1 dihydrofolate reductase [Streptosporangium carneum]